MPDESGDIEIDELARLSVARPAVRLWLLLPPLGLVALVGSILLLSISGGKSLWLPLFSLGLLAASAGAMVWLSVMARRVRAERELLMRLGDGLALRHTGSVLEALLRMLRQPLQMPAHRIIAFEQLSRALHTEGRYDESADAAAVALSHPMLNPMTGFELGCCRAMALLRADRLSDASDAIALLGRGAARLDQLLRQVAEPGESKQEGSEKTETSEEEDSTDLSNTVADALSEGEPGWQVPGETASRFNKGRLVLVELYRDVQTRHSDELICDFEENRSDLIDALGLRFGDALALYAQGLLRVGRDDEARQAWNDAAVLTPLDDLLRRYPELAEVRQSLGEPKGGVPDVHV